MSNSSAMLCVDASLMVRLVADPADKLVAQLWDEWTIDRRRLVAPALIYYELSNALYRYQRAGIMSTETVSLALETALALPVSIYDERALHQRALDFAARLSLPAAYDAHYLALADWLGAEFWTADLRLARAVRENLPWVHAVETGP